MGHDESISLLANSLSEALGRLSVFDAALRAIMTRFTGDEEFAKLLNQELEHEYSKHLGTSTNPIFLQEFEDQMRVFQSKIQAAKDG